jgi:tetratricopeptide (TPR) repeat protein
MIGRVLAVSLVAAALCRPCAGAPEQWTEIRSAHFTVLTDAGEKQGRHVLDQFERMRWVFQTLFPKVNVDPAEPIEVVGTKSDKVFSSMEPAAYLARGQMKLAGLYMHTQDKNYILLELDAEQEHPYATVYHEYTHLQFAGAADWMPLWLNEGLAEFMQNTDIHEKDVALGQPSVDDILYLREHPLIPLNVLFKVDASSPYYHEEQKGSVFYAESWALTHYLMVTAHDQHHNRLDDYMTLLRQHVDPVAAGERAFGDLKKLQTDLDSYIRTAQYKQFVMSSAAAPLDEASYKARSLTAPEADAAKADVLANVGRNDDARALLESVLKQDPHNVQAHETMGYIEFRAGQLEEARKCYEEAVQLDSQDFLAHFYFAVLSMSEPETERDQEIEDSLHAAIRLNSRFAPAYDRLAAFFAMRRENLDEARRMSIWAVQLDPGNLNYRIDAANVLLAMERYTDATAVLQSAAKVAKSPGEVAMVQRQLEVVQRMQAENTEPRAYARIQETASSGGVVDVAPAEKDAVVDVTPKHPTMPATGPKQTAAGVIRGVACSYPSALEFRVVDPSGKAVDLYNNDFYKVALSVADATKGGAVDPCTDLDGKNAQIQYVESSDKSVDGQVVAIQLKK